MNRDLLDNISRLDQMAKSGNLDIISGVNYGGRYVPLPNERLITRAVPQIKYPYENLKWFRMGKWIRTNQKLLQWVIGLITAIIGWFIRK
ncbi:hypothetical protein PBT90_20370 [Algoriphagus halophytocola]|uniref:hypothetical protein n=1 Tax=Algoriphagus halophytocola TaxID=2991499 RepID=UPI0022DDEE5A|nr:hypothetical protein [Algoriphagus sp. TR-M9]WBL42404.1 hypothetical protein PBT90_16835 [Algoriphagus sp. TR-M9]WBL43085.1 hypothetical protein PBT90_20370 [Algoriphagus sp. TR-M9]